MLILRIKIDPALVPKEPNSIQTFFFPFPSRRRLIIQLTSDGEHLGDIVSTPSEDTFTRFGLHENEVETLTLTTSGLGAFQWISVLEVREEILPMLYIIGRKEGGRAVGGLD